MTFENNDDEKLDQQNELVPSADEQAETSDEKLKKQEGVELEEATPEMLLEQLKDAQAQIDEYLDGWQRARAELSNYKKRIERETSEATLRIKAEILSKYLVILDDLERALEERPSEGDFTAWADGIDLIYRKLSALLENEGVTRIEAMGELFDPTYHEALSHEENEDYQENHVIDVIQTGYKLGEQVIRPALVRVAK